MQYPRILLALCLTIFTIFLINPRAEAQNQVVDCALNYLSEMPSSDPDLSVDMKEQRIDQTETSAPLKMRGHTELILSNHSRYSYKAYLSWGSHLSLELTDKATKTTAHFKGSVTYPSYASGFQISLPARGEYKGYPTYEVILSCQVSKK